MTAIPFKLGSALALLTALGLASRARAEPDAAAERAGDELPARANDELPARVPPELMARLTQLQAERRQQRESALGDAPAWAAGRAQRAAQHRREIAQVWGSVVNSLDGQAKLRMHAERMSRLNRMLDLAQHAADPALSARIEKDITRELVRHAQAMQLIRANGGGK
jgi:hypothetical protein